MFESSTLPDFAIGMTYPTGELALALPEALRQDF
jgi:hypothetical protein